MYECVHGLRYYNIGLPFLPFYACGFAHEQADMNVLHLPVEAAQLQRETYNLPWRARNRKVVERAVGHYEILGLFFLRFLLIITPKNDFLATNIAVTQPSFHQ
jgi:hypothetical protein